MTVPLEFWANLVGADDPSLTALIDGPEEERDYVPDTRFEDVLEPLLDQIPARERDIFELRYRYGKRQEEIGFIFNLTQAGIWHLLQRACNRLRFLIECPNPTDEEIRDLLAPHFTERDIDILLRYRVCTNQSRVAEALGKTQGCIRFRIIHSTQRLQKMAARDPRFADVAKIYRLISQYGCIRYEFRNKKFLKPPLVRDERFAE